MKQLMLVNCSGEPCPRMWGPSARMVTGEPMKNAYGWTALDARYGELGIQGSSVQCLS